MSQRQAVPNWVHYANSSQEYEQKERERELNKMKLNSHQDLLSFYLLKKPCQKTVNTPDVHFDNMPDQYLKGITCSLPNNFYDTVQKKPLTKEEFETDKSLLATLLGNTNPPPLHLLSINPLDEEARNTLTLDPILLPIQPKTRSPSKQPPKK